MFAILLAFLQPLVCQTISSDVIKGSDLAAAVPALAGLPADGAFGLSPVPGQHKVYTPGDLERVARANHLTVQPADSVCFEWKLSVPDKTAMAAAMAKTLTGENPHIEILEQSLAPAPPGEVVFPMNGLSASSDKPVIWRGYVEYAPKRQFPIWARVTVSVEEKQVVTTGELHPGDPVDTTALKLETYTGPVRREKYLHALAEADGRLARRALAGGAPLTEDMLEMPREVERGDMVNAIVEVGAARLDVQGVAEDGGRRGQVITIRNPRSGRTFRARVEDKGTVRVVPGGAFGLVPGEVTKS